MPGSPQCDAVASLSCSKQQQDQDDSAAVACVRWHTLSTATEGFRASDPIQRPIQPSQSIDMKVCRVVRVELGTTLESNRSRGWWFGGGPDVERGSTGLLINAAATAVPYPSCSCLLHRSRSPMEQGEGQQPLVDCFCVLGTRCLCQPGAMGSTAVIVVVGLAGLGRSGLGCILSNRWPADNRHKPTHMMFNLPHHTYTSHMTQHSKPWTSRRKWQRCGSGATRRWDWDRPRG